MNYKSTNRRNWQRVPKQRVYTAQLEDVTLVYLKALEVKQALWVNSCGRRIKIMDEGYLWIDVCEPRQNYVVTITLTMSKRSFSGI